MAKIELSEIGTDIRGSTGGNTYSRNTGGLFVRSRVKPINKHTQYTGRQRTTIAYLARLWSNMSSADKTVWNDAAIAPQKGYGLFISQNEIATKILADVTLSPLTPQPIEPLTFTLALDATGDSFIITSDRPTTGDEAAYIMISSTLSPGISIRPSAVRAIPVAYFPASTYEFLPDFRHKFGFDPDPGYLITVSVQICNYIGLNANPPIFASDLTY